MFYRRFIVHLNAKKLPGRLTRLNVVKKNLINFSTFGSLTLGSYYLGDTDKIDFQSFYPLIAAAIQACRMHPDLEHPAVRHKILNSPNPSSGDVVEFPNGWKAKLVLLGERIPMSDTSSPNWWPTAESPDIRSKLFRRILSDGFLLPIVLATTLALVSEIYTTTAVPKSEVPHWQFSGRRRVRLSYNRSPFADIGIAKGTCTRVTPQDQLAYYNINTNQFLMGQDPNDHYWIYFTTLHGHEYFLDCGMMPFNFTLLVDVRESSKYGLPPLQFAPALFYGRELAKVLPRTDRIGWQAQERFSILRNLDLHDVLRTRNLDYCKCHDIPTIHNLLDTIAGRHCTDFEKNMTMEFFKNTSKVFRLNIQNREYLNFSKEPQLGLELDPDERLKADAIEEDDVAYEEYLKKWTRRLKKGKITSNQWDAAFNKWQAKPHEMRMKMADVNKN